MRPSLAAAAGVLALAWASPVCPEPLSLDIILGLERFGRVVIDPSGAVGVFEERRARNDLPRHDLPAESAIRQARLYRIDLDAPGLPRPLLPMAKDAGYTLGAFSPTGRSLVVYRLQDETWRLGLVEMASGRVTWTTVSPDLGLWGRAVAWTSDDTLVALGMTHGRLPPRLSGSRLQQQRLQALRAAATAGEAAAVSVGLDDRSDALEPRRLWRIDAATGQATAIADGPYLDVETSPDGRYAALLRDGPLLPPPDLDHPTEVRRARSLEIVALDTGVIVRPPEARNISTSLLAWSPTSHALLVAAIDADPARLLAIAPNGLVQDVTPPGVHPTTPVDFQGMATAVGGWAGASPLFKGRAGSVDAWFQAGPSPRRLKIAPDARLVAQGRSAVLFNSDGQVVRLTVDGETASLGPARLVTDPGGPYGLRAQSSPMQADYAAASDADGRTCRVWAAPRPAPRPDGACVAAAPGAAISWSRRLSLDRGDADQGLNTLWLQTEDRRTPLWRLNPELEGLDIAAPRRVAGAGGASGWLYLPLTRTPAPPVIVVPYQGEINPTPPTWMGREATDLALAPQLLVAAGYAILIPDLPPTPEPADGLAQRLLAVVDAAADDGLVDPERIGLWGWSFGAWSAVMSAAQSSRFDAVVALNGPMNFSTVIGDVGSRLRLEGGHPLAAAASARWLESGQAAMGEAYWRAPDRYRRNSPFDQADRITAPVLLVAGEDDLMLGQTEQMYGALHRLGRPVALTLLIGEGHGIQNPGNARLYYEQVRTWFDRHLRPDAGPDAPATGEARPPSGPD